MEARICTLCPGGYQGPTREPGLGLSVLWAHRLQEESLWSTETWAGLQTEAALADVTDQAGASVPTSRELQPK